jgi:hypothetical protein
MRFLVSLSILLTTGGGLGACAALSGLEPYATDDCRAGCTDDVAMVDATETDASAVSDAAERTDANGSTDANKTTEASFANPFDAIAEANADADADAGTAALPDAGVDASMDAGEGSGAEGGDAGSSTLGSGLVAYYAFDETSGTTAADSSGNGNNATLVGGPTFVVGVQNNAVKMSGSGQYVALPDAIVNGLTSFSICTWAYVSTPIAAWSRIFDFGMGIVSGTNPTTYMFFTPDIGTGTARFAITTTGYGGEQRIDAPAMTGASWQHVAVTLTGSAGTVYFNGARTQQNTALTLSAASLGATTKNWLGRSEYTADPYLTGELDNLRIYNRALSDAEVQALYAGKL